MFRAGIGNPLSNLKKAQIIHLDIGAGDPVTPEPIQTETPNLLGDGTLSWSVYPVETTVAEKLHALVVRASANSRSKDIFDLTLLLPKCDTDLLFQAIEATFRYRGDKMPDDVSLHLEQMDTKLLKMGWASAVTDIPAAPSFEDAFSELVNQLKGKIGSPK